MCLSSVANWVVSFVPVNLARRFEAVELVAVNQCSGNSRGFSSPRVAGGQLGNGAMGNARWRGVPLKTVLDMAGIQPGARPKVCEQVFAASEITSPSYWLEIFFSAGIATFGLVENSPAVIIGAMLIRHPLSGR